MKIITFTLFITLSLLSGCVSFGVYDLPAPPDKPIPTDEKKPVSFNVRYRNALGPSIPDAERRFREEIAVWLENSNMFRDVVYSPNKSGLHIEIEINAYPNNDLSFAEFQISAFTGFLIPAYKETEYEVVINVYDGKNLTNTFIYSDRVKQIVQTLLIVITPFFYDTKEAIVGVVGNMFDNFVYDYSIKLASKK